MTDKKITDFPAKNDLDGTEQVYVVSGGQDFRASSDLLGTPRISTDDGNSLVLGTDGKLYVPPIIPDSASVALSWLYLGSGAEANPGANYWRANDANPANVTEIYVSEVAWANRNVSNIIEVMGPGDVIYLQQRNDENKYINADLLEVPTDNGPYFTLKVAVFDSDQPLDINQFTDFIVYHEGGGDGPSPTPGLKNPVFTYTADQLTRIDYDNGSFKTLTYIGDSVLDTISFTENGITTTQNFVYDSEGRLTQIVET